MKRWGAVIQTKDGGLIGPFDSLAAAINWRIANPKLDFDKLIVTEHPDSYKEYLDKLNNVVSLNK